MTCQYAGSLGNFLHQNSGFLFCFQDTGLLRIIWGNEELFNLILNFLVTILELLYFKNLVNSALQANL